jgi:hypothetical protein
MTGVVRSLLRAGLLLVVLLLAAVLLMFAGTPRVSATGDVSVNDVRRARALLARHDPRRVRNGVANEVVLTQQDVTLLTQYAASRWRRAASQVTLRDGSAEVQLSVDVNAVPFARWLNLDATVRNADGLPAVERLRVGHLPVPAFAAEPVAEFVLARLAADMPLSLAREMVHTVAFTPTSVRIAYTWQKDATTRVRDMLLPPADLLRLQAAHEDLSRLIRAQEGAGPRPLVTLLVPMLQQAAARAAGGDAVAEHRAVLVTLTLYVTRRSLGRYVRRARSWSAIPARIVTLGRREDLAKHFLVSAVVASQSGESLADAVGRTKEVEDSRGGTGFSFADIAADRAGTRFGELATQDPSRLADAVSAGLDESAMMPVVTDLPESMTAAQFEQRFGGIGAPAYDAMMQRIESRLAALPLYRP